jgi:hypothetical protein
MTGVFIVEGDQEIEGLLGITVFSRDWWSALESVAFWLAFTFTIILVIHYPLLLVLKQRGYVVTTFLAFPALEYRVRPLAVPRRL